MESNYNNALLTLLRSKITVRCFKLVSSYIVILIHRVIVV